MPRVEQSIIIQGNPEQIFTITNDIARWPDLFLEYRHARILSAERSGRFTMLKFELSNAEGETWRSWRILDHEELVAIAQREAPMFPFLYMHLLWRYQPVEGGVRMTWIQDFEIDPKAPVTNDQARVRMLSHMAENQEHFKQVLEAQADATRTTV